MEFLSNLLNALAAVIFSALSSMGVGGGSLLLVYLTELRGMEQEIARGVNLVCFLVSGLGALPFYLRLGLLSDPKRVGRLLLPGVLFAILGVAIAARLDSGLVRKIFGGFLVLAALLSLFSKKDGREKTAPAEKLSGGGD